MSLQIKEYVVDEDQLEKKKFDDLWEENMKVARANFELMQKAGGSVYEYNPYTRYYLSNQDAQNKKPNSDKKPNIAERIDDIKKRFKKK